MKFLILAACFAVRAAAGPSGSFDAHTAAATGYSGAYLETVALSLAADPLYGSRLLDSFDLHLRSVAAMTSAAAVTDYLEVAVIGAGLRSVGALKAALGTEPMEPPRAAALMLAHALARPEQFHEVLDGLEARQAGLGRHTARILREARGGGDKRLIAALRARGEAMSKGSVTSYDRFSRLALLFDEGGVEAPAARPRRTVLEPARE